MSGVGAAPGERTLVFVDQLRSWMTDAEAGMALGVPQAELSRLCDDGVVRSAETPLGRLLDPHSVNTLKCRMVQKEEA